MVNSETIQPVVEQVEWLIPLIGLAIPLNFLQRKAIRKRDGERCQSDDKRIRHGGRLEVDHIIPKEFAEEALKLRPEQYNHPNNLLTKCENHHRGHPSSHHPDIHQALDEYQKGDHEAINRRVAEHKAKAQRGEVYWNNERDGIDRTKAIINTQKMDEKKGGRKRWWPF